MSSEADEGASDATVSREVAWRVFAREYNDADYAFKEGDDERAPNYVATPTSAKINRLFVVGVLTEIERVGDGDLLRARVSDPTGAFVVYAGQYQPDAVSFLADAETPSFVAVVGKARTYEPEDSDDVYTSIRPEGINVVDAETRDRWNVETAHESLKRVEAVRDHIRTGETPETRPPLHELGDIVDHYGTDETYLSELEREARDVLTEVVGVEADAGTGVGASDDVGEYEPEHEPEGADEAEAEGPTAEPEATETDEAEAQGAEADDTTAADFGDVEQEDVGEWEWDEGEREEIEEEFGAEFESGADLTDEGSDHDETDEADTEDAEGTEETEGSDETDDSGASDSAETVVMGIIEEENGDEGAERSTIITEAADRGVDEDVAEAALEDLLLEGMCYPTDGDRIKPL
jgi:RPA family protein